MTCRVMMNQDDSCRRVSSRLCRIVASTWLLWSPLLPMVSDAWSDELARRPAIVGQPAITAITFSPDGQYLLAASQGGVVQYRWPDLEPIRAFPNPWLAIHGLAFSPTGDQLAMGGGDPAAFGGLAILDWPAGTTRAVTIAHDDVVYQASWRPNHHELVTVSGDRAVLSWALAPNLQPRGLAIRGHSRGVIGATFLSDSATYLVTGSRDHSLRLWDLTTGALLRTLDNHTAPVTALAARPLGPGPPWLASCGEDRTVRFWQPTIGRMVRFNRLPSIPLAVVWTPDGEQVVVGCRDGRLRLISPLARGEPREVPGIAGWAHAVAVHPEGKQAVVAGEQGEIRLLDLTGGVNR